MNGIVSFRLCKLTNKQLAEKVDQLTDNLYKLGPEKVISRHIPARPDEDYDLLVGELVMRFTELYDKLDKSDDIPNIIGRTPPTEEQREPIENAFYATGTMSPEAATELTTDILQYISDANMKIVYDR